VYAPPATPRTKGVRGLAKIRNARRAARHEEERGNFLDVAETSISQGLLSCHVARIIVARRTPGAFFRRYRDAFTSTIVAFLCGKTFFT